MELSLQILSNSTLKRKSAAAHFKWIGGEKDSLLVIDDDKTNSVDVSSGKTKKKLSAKFTSCIQDCAFIGTFANGLIVGSVKLNGELLIYRPDQDTVEEIHSNSDLANLIKDGPLSLHLFIDNEASNICVIVDFCEIYVWIRGTREGISGIWYKIKWDSKIPLPDPKVNNETIISSANYSNEYLGKFVCLTFTFVIKQKIYFPTVVLREDSGNARQPKNFEAVWNCVSTDLISPVSQNRADLLQASYSPARPLLACGVNTKKPCDCQMLYMDPISGTVWSRPMFGLGIPDSRKARSRHCWIKSLAWDNQGHFVVGATGMGFLFVAPRLCSPNPVHASGCGLEFGPGMYLPVHPLVVSSSAGEAVTDQTYSILCHPNRPIFLFSDGFRLITGRLPSLSADAIPRACLNGMYDAVAEVNFELGQGLSPRLNACQQFNEDQMARVARWTATQSSLGEDVEAMRQLEERIDAEDEEDALDDTLVSDKIVGDEVEAMQTLAVMAPEYSDSGWHSLFGDDPDAWWRRCRHLLGDAWGYLLSSDAPGSEQRCLLADAVLEGAHRLLLTLFATLVDVDDEAGREDGISEVVLRASSLLNLILNGAQLDAVRQECLVTLGRFIEASCDLFLSGRQTCPLADHLCLPYRLIMAHRWSSTASRRLSDVYGMARRESNGTWWPRMLLRHLPLQDEEKTESPYVLRTFASVWKQLLRYYKLLCSRLDGEESLRAAIVELEGRLRQGIGEKAFEMDTASLPKAGRPERLLLAGKDDEAMDAWRRLLSRIGHQGGKLHMKRSSRSLHSILYLTILHGDVRGALDLITLVSYTSDSLQWEKFPFLKVFKSQFIDKMGQFALRRATVVRSMARWMAAYFADLPLYISPPHMAYPLPPIMQSDDQDEKSKLDEIRSRRLPLQHSTVAKLIRQHGLDHEFNVDRCLEWMVLSGLLDEATWFANRLGDWRSAFVLAYSTELAKEEQKIQGKRLRVRCNLGDELSPSSILLSHGIAVAERIVSDTTAMDTGREDTIIRGFRDLLTASCMAGCLLLTPLLAELLKRALALSQELALFVAPEVYLPAPPIFCPQTPPEPTTNRHSETWIRHALWRHFHLAALLLRAGNAALPAAGWFAQQLLNAQERDGDELCSPDWVLDYIPFGEVLYDSHEAGLSVPELCDATGLLNLFRDLSCLAWRLQARDKLSGLMRQRAGGEAGSMASREWLELSHDCLVWCQHLIPFARYHLDVDKRSELQHALLSVLLEFDPEPSLADILITWNLSPASDDLRTDVIERLDDLLHEWKEKYLEDDAGQVEVERRHRTRRRPRKEQPRSRKVKRGATMSSYFYARLAAQEEEMEEEQEELHVQMMVRTGLQIGARRCETDPSFLDFTSMLFSVWFARTLEAASSDGAPPEQQPTPLLAAFSSLIQERTLRDVVGGGSHYSPRSPRLPIPSPRSGARESKSFPRTTQMPLSARSDRRRSGSVSGRSSGSGSASGSTAGATTFKRRQRSSSVCGLDINLPQRENVDGKVPTLNLNELNSNKHSPGFSNRRSSLSDIRSNLQDRCAGDAYLFTPRGSVNNGAAGSQSSCPSFALISYPLEFDLPPLYHDLYDRLTWLVRWSHRQPSNSLCRNGTAPSIRLRLNPQLLVYTAFGVRQHERARQIPQPMAHQEPRKSHPRVHDFQHESQASKSQDRRQQQHDPLDFHLNGQSIQESFNIPQRAPPLQFEKPLEKQSSRESLFSGEESSSAVSSYSSKLRLRAKNHFADFVAEQNVKSRSASKNGSAPSGGDESSDLESVETWREMEEEIRRREEDRENLIFSVDLDNGTFQSNNSALAAPRRTLDSDQDSPPDTPRAPTPDSMSSTEVGLSNQRSDSHPSTSMAITTLTGWGAVSESPAAAAVNGSTLPGTTASTASFIGSIPRSTGFEHSLPFDPPRPSSPAVTEEGAAEEQRPRKSSVSIVSSSPSPLPPLPPAATANSPSASVPSSPPPPRLATPEGAKMKTSNRQMTSELQSMLRGEFRRILAAQQAGMMVLLDAMNNEENGEEEVEVGEESSRRRHRGRRRLSGRQAKSKRGSDLPSPGSDFTEITELPSGIELTPKTPSSRRRYSEEDEDEEDDEEAAAVRANIAREFSEVPDIRHAVSELNNIRKHQSYERPHPVDPDGFPAHRFVPQPPLGGVAPDLPRIHSTNYFAAPTPFPSPSLSPRVQLPFPLLTAHPSKSRNSQVQAPGPSVRPPVIGIPLLRLQHSRPPAMLVQPPPPHTGLENRLLPPRLVADFIKEKRQRELAARQPLKVLNPDNVNQELRQRLSDTLAPSAMAPPPLLSVSGGQGPVIVTGRREAFLPPDTVEEREEEKETLKEKEKPDEITKTPEKEETSISESLTETPVVSRRGRSDRRRHLMAPAQVDQGTTTFTDAGTQADSVSDEEDDKVIYQGYALTPGSVLAPVQTSESAVMTTPRGAFGASVPPPIQTTELGIMTSPRQFQAAAVMAVPQVSVGTAAQVDENNVPILTPDLLGNLRFDNGTGGRRFLSVVSVDHGLWDELVGKMPGMDAQQAESLRPQVPMSDKTVVRPRRESPEREQVPGPDPLTQKLLLGEKDEDEEEEDEGDDDSLAVYRRDKRSRMTANMTRTLLDMDIRLRDIKEMHSKMEREFPNIHNLVDDVEAVDLEAQRRYPFLAPESKQKRKKEKKSKPEVKANKEVDTTEVEEAAALQETKAPEDQVGATPNADICAENNTVPSPHPPSTPEPVDHEMKPSDSPRLSEPFEEFPSPHDHIPSTCSNATSADVDDNVLRLTDVEDVDEALSGRPSPPPQTSSHLREDKVRISGGSETGRTPEERAKFQRWMNERRARQLADYRRERQSRVESEAHPFRSTSTNLRDGETPQQMETARMEREIEMVEEREKQARRLANEAIKGLGLPVQPQPAPSTTQKKKGEDTERRGARRKGQSHPSPVQDEFEFKTYEEYDRYLDRMMELSSAATSEILNPEPGRAPSTPMHQQKIQQQSHEEEEEMVPYRPQKRKPFAEMVRLQRPESTRKGPSRRPLNREEMFASLRESKGFVPKSPQPGSVRTNQSFGGATYDRQNTSARRQGIMAEREPRKNVKTYAQRLQDLQPRKPLHQANRDVRGPLRSRPSQRLGGRPEPYQTRQTGLSLKTEEDMTSILSDWSVSDDVKRILYGAPTDPNANPLRRTIDEVNSQALDMDQHSESTASYIDWDQIDQLVQNA